MAKPFAQWTRSDLIFCARMLVASAATDERVIARTGLYDFAAGVLDGLNRDLRARGEAGALLTDVYPPNEPEIAFMRRARESEEGGR